MQRFDWTKKLTVLVLTAALAGCGAGPTTPLKLDTKQDRYAAEAVPSAAALKLLEEQSPDTLIPNAPPEPGYSANFIGPKPPSGDLDNFGKVEDTLWRGARPTDAGLEKLKAMGVKTLVNFENDKQAVEHEQAWAQANGIKFVSIPLSVITPPKLAKIQQFLDLAQAPQNRPLYFHCMQGRDRTGTAAFSYRIAHDGWNYDRAYNEMVSYHFHTYLLGLRYFLTTFASEHGRPPSLERNMTAGNSAKLHVSPSETLPALKSLINGAQRSVYLEAFSLGNDSYGQQLIPLLVSKAKAGVEVKVLMDYVGSRFIKGHSAMVETLEKGGVDVEHYNFSAITDADKNTTLNITHRKLYMADGTHALVGGVNLHAPFDTITHDLLIDWRGPVITQLYREFAHDWSVAGGGGLRQQANPDPAAGTVTAQVAVTSPLEGRYEGRDVVFNAIDNAKREILVEQQYIWDDKFVLHLKGALQRGVKVRVLIPGGEQKLVQRTLNGECGRQLVAAGAEVRSYLGVTEDAHLHTKYFAVDDSWAITGSMNADTRSLIDNQELGIVTTDTPLIAQLRERLFDRDWTQHSEPFSYKPASPIKKPFLNVLQLIDYYL